MTSTQSALVPGVTGLCRVLAMAQMSAIKIAIPNKNSMAKSFRVTQSCHSSQLIRCLLPVELCLLSIPRDRPRIFTDGQIFLSWGPFIVLSWPDKLNFRLSLPDWQKDTTTGSKLAESLYFQHLGKSRDFTEKGRINTEVRKQTHRRGRCKSFCVNGLGFGCQ